MSKFKEVLNWIMLIVMLASIVFLTFIITKTSVLRQQERIQYEMELELIEEVNYWKQEAIAYEIISDIQSEYIDYLEDRVMYLYEKVLDTKDQSNDHEEDLEYAMLFLSIIIDYFDLENHPDITGEEFELYIYTNFPELYNWIMDEN